MAAMEILLLNLISIFSDVVAAFFSYALCSSLLLSYKITYSKGFIDVYLLGKLCHITEGLIVMLCWPMFSPAVSGRVMAGLIPGFCMILPPVCRKRRPEQFVKLFVNKYRDSRHLLIAAVSYGLTIAFATIFYWKRPIAIAAICNLCAGDGVADIAGRRYGRWKLPYNKNKSFAGSISMAIAGFFASTTFMSYFCWLGWNINEESPNVVLGFLAASIASAAVESHPLSSTFEDNLTVPIASILVGTFVL